MKIVTMLATTAFAVASPTPPRTRRSRGTPFLQQMVLTMSPKTSAFTPSIRRSRSSTKALILSRKTPGSMSCQTTATR